MAGKGSTYVVPKSRPTIRRSLFDLTTGVDDDFAGLSAGSGKAADLTTDAGEFWVSVTGSDGCEASGRVFSPSNLTLASGKAE